MKIANADKLKKHFENVVDVKLFTAAEISTIIDTFSAEVTEGRKYVFSYDYDGTPIITDLDAKQREEELLGIASEKRKEGYWKNNEVYDGDEYYECSNCGEPWVLMAGTPKDNNMNYCPNCGAWMVGGTRP